MEGLGSSLPRRANAGRKLIPAFHHENMAVAVDFNLYLITDRRQTGGRALSAAVEQALRGGVRAVQLREKDLPIAGLRALAGELRRLTARFGARLLINGRIDIAGDVHADGVHLPEDSPSIEGARKILGPERLIGVSCHSLESAQSAQRSGADFITFGPVFYTPSKAAFGSPLGLERLAEAAASLEIPVYGLGGISERNASEVMAAGARGIAVISSILAAEQPMLAAKAMLETLGGNKP